jgi:hypothetical protein
VYVQQISVGERGFGPDWNADAPETVSLVDTLLTVGGVRLSWRWSKLSAGGVIRPRREWMVGQMMIHDVGWSGNFIELRLRIFGKWFFPSE